MKKEGKITLLDKTLSKSEYYQEVIVEPAEKLLKALLDTEVKEKTASKVQKSAIS